MSLSVASLSVYRRCHYVLSNPPSTAVPCTVSDSPNLPGGQVGNRSVNRAEDNNPVRRGRHGLSTTDARDHILIDAFVSWRRACLFACADGRQDNDYTEETRCTDPCTKYVGIRANVTSNSHPVST